MDPFLSNLKNVKTTLAHQTPSSSSARHTMLPPTPKYSLTNKKECVQCIIGFLASKGFQPCSGKELLRSPPLQVLLDIWNFLFRMVDGTANVTKDNMAIEVPKFFKEFGYPHIMKTSHLRTPTADHQWESNLVALSWLCKLLLYEQECFDKPFLHRGKLEGQGNFPIHRGAHGKASISNGIVAQFVTDQATKHYQLYLQGEENSLELMQDFESTIEERLVKLQMSVDSKTESLEELRERTLELQEELEGFARIKEWIKKANIELKRIEELTESLQKSCDQAEEELKVYKEKLKKEQLSLEEQEQRKRELEQLIESQNVKKNVLHELNQTIKTLRNRISENNRKIKELEHEIAALESSAHSTELQLVRTQNSLSSTHESIKNFLINNGDDCEAWNNLESIRVNLSGAHESEILGVSPAAYEHVVEEIIHTDRNRMKLKKEARVELEAANKELENLVNTLSSQTAELLREKSTLFKEQVLEEKESALQMETEKLAESIRKAAKEKLESVKHELEATEASIVQLNSRIQEQEAQAQETWKAIVEHLKKIYKNSKEGKEHNRRELRKLIEVEKSILQAKETTTEENINDN